MSTPTDAWSPAQYEKFRNERMQPFFDLAALIKPEGVRRAIDVGCGTGELAVMLAERLPDATIEGVDASTAMLEQARPRAGDRVSFRQADATTLDGWQDYDLVFSNAVLQWLPDNDTLLNRILTGLRPGAQIAVQVPTNDNHPSHRIAAAIASEEPFRGWLGGYVRRSFVLTLEQYSAILWQHGLHDQICFEKIYPHELEDTLSAAEWVKGTLLTAYLGRLDAPQQATFLDAYRARLLEELGEQSPFYYPFRRLLFWGRKQS